MTNSVSVNYTAAVITIAALVISLFAVAMPASANSGGHGSRGGETDNSVTIKVDNNATVINTTTADADTGDNYAGGSEGGDGDEGGNGGSGGDAEDNESNGDNNAGDGGNGGAGGDGGVGGPGGLIVTGNAEANAGTVNTVNSTDIEVEGCGCEDEEDGDDMPWYMRFFGGHDRGGDRDTDNSVYVDVDNDATVINKTDADADTGDNAAKGSEGGDGDEGGNGGSGGDAEDNEGADNDRRNNQWGHWYDTYFGGGDSSSDGDNNAGDAGNGGAGGDGGAGGVGGEVQTGNAESNSGTVNVVNTTVVRTTR
jgi:hypothetical protein